MALIFLSLLCSICFLLVPLVGTQQITFEVKDSEFNEVVFVGETEVNMECIIRGVQNVSSIKIQQRQTSQVIYSQGRTNLQYLIRNVSTNDGGYYRCSVTYIDMQSNSVETQIRDLFLNVVDNRPQCTYNGTKSLTYSENDVFSLTCYCFKTDSCLWIRSTEGSGVSSLIATQTIFRGDKQILTAVTGSLSDVNEGIKFMCFYGSYFNQRCEIGPFYLSNFLDGTTRVSINTTQSLAIYFSERKITENILYQTGSTVITSSEQKDKSIGERNGISSYIWYIVVAVIVVLVFVGVIILLIVFISRNGNKEDEYPLRISYNAAFYSESSNNKNSTLQEQSGDLANDMYNLNSNTNVNNMVHHNDDIPSSESGYSRDTCSQAKKELGSTDETFSVCNNISDPPYKDVSEGMKSGPDDDHRSTNSTETNDDCCASGIDNALSSTYCGLDFSDLYALVDTKKDSKQMPESEA
ncbi:hypothetical protein HOLleu_28032 [Holothuria leucospilota]|uniref:Ig-like domain-containing protein n=1 Tax=Holothuria leucospilota TaxID=206669 RepID=A0A9Q1H189_HOLLE|nr:hypothetical protein HOLleu_28032 [Holothuria leucospilota]